MGLRIPGTRHDSVVVLHAFVLHHLNARVLPQRVNHLLKVSGAEMGRFQQGGAWD